jgi:hypothetical protein
MYDEFKSLSIEDQIQEIRKLISYLNQSIVKNDFDESKKLNPDKSKIYDTRFSLSKTRSDREAFLIP